MSAETGQAVDWIAFHGDRQPDKLALVDLASGRRQTYGQLHDRVGRIAAMLQTLGVKPGDRVGFYALNSTDILDIVFATWRIGGVSLALNFRLTTSELEFIINDSTPDVVFVDDEFVETAVELQGLTRVKHWVRLDGKGGNSPFEDGIAAATPLAEGPALSLDDQCMLMYSSGTTGKPKGVIITHGMLFWSALNAQVFADIGRETVNLCFMPLFHIGGFNVFASPTAYAGGTTVVMRAADPEHILDSIDDAEMGITHVLGVPAIFNAMKQSPKALTTDYSRIKLAIAGAEAVPVDLLRWWHENAVTITEGYGMTESAASNCSLPLQDVPVRMGSAGKPTMHGEMDIFREDGTPADDNELGEIWMRGPAITPGYWNRPEANKESFVDGWFKSGDIGRRDKDGYFYIEDRVKDMYISGGENVYPAEVENVLYMMPQILEAAVIGVPDEKWGEVGCACVVLKEGQSLSLAEMTAQCAEHLATYKQPRYLHFMDMLPRNATGKVLKFQLRQTVPKELGLK